VLRIPVDSSTIDRMQNLTPVGLVGASRCVGFLQFVTSILHGHTLSYYREHFLLKYGRELTARHAPCYRQTGNAFDLTQKLALSDDQLSYTEGYVSNGTSIEFHSWITTAEEEVMEVAPKDISPLGTLSYFGVPFQPQVFDHAPSIAQHMGVVPLKFHSVRDIEALAGKVRLSNSPQFKTGISMIDIVDPVSSTLNTYYKTLVSECLNVLSVIVEASTDQGTPVDEATLQAATDVLEKAAVMGLSRWG